MWVCIVTLCVLLSWSVWASLRQEQHPPAFRAAVLAMMQNRYGEAEALFDRALQTQPDDPTLYRAILTHCHRKRQWPMMVEYGRRAVARCQKAPAAARADLYASLAAGLVEAKMPRWQLEAVDAARQAYRLAPRDPEMLNLYGYLLVDLCGNAASLMQADTLLREALEILGRQGNASSTRALMAVIQDSYAWLLYKRGDYAGAIPILTQAISTLVGIAQDAGITPDADTMKTMHYHLGATYRMAGRKTEAEQALRVALLYDPNYGEAKAEMASLQVQTIPNFTPQTAAPAVPPNP
jgi:tetratricopeptide (TPR) repeat protein